MPIFTHIFNKCLLALQKPTNFAPSMSKKYLIPPLHLHSLTPVRASPGQAADLSTELQHFILLYLVQ